jgi:transcriptional regulator with XRE-family HTH domain
MTLSGKNYTTLSSTTSRNISKPLDLKAIGTRIRKIRRSSGLNQAEFGRKLGIGQGQLSKYELGVSAPTTEILLKLKNYSGKSIDWIVTGGQ